MHSICPRALCTYSNKAFACGLLTAVGLHVIPYDTHRYSKCSLNLLLLLYIKWWHHGYLHNQVLFTNLAMQSEVFSKISSAVSSSLPLTICLPNWLITGSSAIINQLEAGTIMVRAIKTICKLSLPLSVYEPIRSTRTHSQGSLMTGLGGRCPNLSDHPLFIWKVLQDLNIDQMVEHDVQGVCVQCAEGNGDTIWLHALRVA